MKISEVWYVSGAFFVTLKKDPEFAPHNFIETLYFASGQLTKKALIPLGIRAFPNFAFLSCGADGNRTYRL